MEFKGKFGGKFCVVIGKGRDLPVCERKKEVKTSTQVALHQLFWRRKEKGRSGWLCFLYRWNNALVSQKCYARTNYVW